MLVHEFLERTADRFPEKVALVCDGHRLTYADIDQRANQLAHAFRANGVRRGDRVVLYLKNSVELVVGIFAALKASAVFVVVNHSVKHSKLTYILNDSTASAFVTSGCDYIENFVVKKETPSVQCVVSTGGHCNEVEGLKVLNLKQVFSDYPTSRLVNLNIDKDLACLVYTSGSTGDPKGVMSDHSNVDFATSSIIQCLGNTESDIVICVLPLSFDYGLYQLLMVFKFGGTLVLEKGFVYPAAMLKRIAHEKVTGLPGIPTLFSVLLQMDLSQFDLSSVRYITNTAAALPLNQIIGLRNKFPWARVFSMYGLTETKRTLILPPEELDRRPLSVGIAIPGTEVWLEDENGNRLGANCVGELVVRGRHVMRGYWNAPELTAQRYRPGPLPGETVCYSGDLFKRDEDGFYYFVSRKDDIIKCKGEKVSPIEVERTLYNLDGIVEAAVIGVPDPMMGQAIKAFVVCNNRHLDPAAIIRFCRSNLEDHMVPKFVEIVSALPKTSSGKIDKKELY